MLNSFQHPFVGPEQFMPRERQPCVYILASQPHGTLYIGVTSNLAQRLYQHRAGDMGGFTTRYAVQRLVRFELFGDMSLAIGREKQLKRWHRPWKINLIQSDNPDWHDLAPALGLTPVAQRSQRHGC